MRWAGRTSRLLPDRLGHRGASLLFFAILDLGYGASFLDPRSWPRGPQAEATFHVIRDIASFPVWGVVWFGIGLVCLVQAFMRWDALAFGLAISLKLTWGVSFIFAWLIYDAYRGWLSALIWLTFAFFVAVIADWPEAPPHRERSP